MSCTTTILKLSGSIFIKFASKDKKKVVTNCTTNNNSVTDPDRLGLCEKSGTLKGTQDLDFFGFDFEICIISFLVMSKY